MSNPLGPNIFTGSCRMNSVTDCDCSHLLKFFVYDKESNSQDLYMHISVYVFIDNL